MLARHGLGSVTVTTAGGTSARARTLNALRPGSDSAAARLRSPTSPSTAATGRDLGDSTTDQPEPRLVRIDAEQRASVLQTITLDTTNFDGRLHGQHSGLRWPASRAAAPSASKRRERWPQGSLLLFNGNNNQIVAINSTTGAVIVRLAPTQNYSFDAGVYDAATGHFFVLGNSNVLVELDTATGATVASHALAINVQSYAGLAIDPTTGSLVIGAYNLIGQLVFFNRAGVEQRRIDITAQGVDNNEISGIAFAPDGSLRIASTHGVIYKVTVPAVQKNPNSREKT